MSDGLDVAALALAAGAYAQSAATAAKIDRQERVAFVEGYRHNRATVDEKRYYAECIGVLYPVPSAGTPLADKLLALLALGYVAFGGWLGWGTESRHDVVLQCFAAFLAGAGALAVFFILIGIVWFALWLVDREPTSWLLAVVLALGLVGGIAGPVVLHAVEHWNARVAREEFERAEAAYDAIEWTEPDPHNRYIYRAFGRQRTDGAAR